MALVVNGGHAKWALPTPSWFVNSRHAMECTNAYAQQVTDGETVLRHQMSTCGFELVRIRVGGGRA